MNESLLKLTITLAFLIRVRVVKKSLSVMSPRHAAKLDPLQSVLKQEGIFNPQEVDLYPV